MIEAAVGSRLRTVLVVEDEEPVRLLLQAALGRAFDVVEAESGEAGLAAAAASRPDVMLLDLGLPGIDGLEVCRRLRADPVLGELPIVMLTARTAPEDRVLGFAAGATAYLTKPFRPTELLRFLDELLAER